MVTKAEKFIGKVYAKHVVRAVVDLITLTSSNFRIYKTSFTSEKSFWAVMYVITKLKPLPDEDFAASVFRIKGTFGRYSKAKRASMISSVTQKEILDAMDGVFGIPSSVLAIPTAKTVLVTKSEKKKRVKARNEELKNLTPTRDQKEEFYKSWAWRELRKKVLNEFGARCQCCGACNQGAGAWDETDHRPKPATDEWITPEDEIPEIIRQQLKDYH